jgi:bisphosphoglycerate-independent phosphoglycerate mutase (AlkP superfamily)
VKGKAKEHAHIFFDINGIVHKEFVWKAKQSIHHTTVTFYDDCVKMCEDYAPDFGDKNWLFHHDNT